MKRFYTAKEITEALKRMTIICDTREQVNGHVTDYYAAQGILHETRKLHTGDYSATVDEYTLENDIVIERKANLDEMAGNFTVDRQRFEDEFTRAKADGVKVFLLIEDASYYDIECHNYRSKLLPKSFLASLLSWQARFNITIVFCRKDQTGRIIHGVLYYWLKQALEQGG